MDRTRAGYPSALHPSARFHRRDLPPLVLANVDGTDARSEHPTGGQAQFVVGTPEVRCRIKATVLWIPAPENPLVLPDVYWSLQGMPPAPVCRLDGCGLWVAKREDTALGGRAFSPVENLAGDIFQPAPLEVGCLGWTVEAETAADEIYGRLTITTTHEPGAGRWVVRAAADAVEEMTGPEWDRVTSRFFIRALQSCHLSNPEEVG
jgi:hypothetical protein